MPVQSEDWAVGMVRCERCELSGRGLCDELITRPEESSASLYVN